MAKMTGSSGKSAFKMKTVIQFTASPLATFGVTSLQALAQKSLDVANMVAEKAQENVSRGVGPNKARPVHPEFEDTESLKKAVKTRKALRGFVARGEVYINPAADMHPGRNGSAPRPPEVYGIALEMGFNVLTKKGDLYYYRYPWLTPAWQEVLASLPDYMQGEVQRTLQDAVAMASKKKSVVVKEEISTDSPSNNFASKAIGGFLNPGELQREMAQMLAQWQSRGGSS